MLREPWRVAEDHYRRLEEDYKKYGTGNCECCGNPVWYDERFCNDCMVAAVEDLQDFAKCVHDANGWPQIVALETALRDLTRGKRRAEKELYEAAADRIADRMT